MDTVEPTNENLLAQLGNDDWKRTRSAIKQRAAWIEEYLGEGWVEIEPGIYAFASGGQAEPSAG